MGKPKGGNTRHPRLAFLSPDLAVLSLTRWHRNGKIEPGRTGREEWSDQGPQSLNYHFPPLLTTLYNIIPRNAAMSSKILQKTFLFSTYCTLKFASVTPQQLVVIDTYELSRGITNAEKSSVPDLDFAEFPAIAG